MATLSVALILARYLLEQHFATRVPTVNAIRLRQLDESYYWLWQGLESAIFLVALLILPTLVGGLTVQRSLNGNGSHVAALGRIFRFSIVGIAVFLSTQAFFVLVAGVLALFGWVGMVVVVLNLLESPISWNGQPLAMILVGPVAAYWLSRQPITVTNRNDANRETHAGALIPSKFCVLFTWGTSIGLGLGGALNFFFYPKVHQLFEMRCDLCAWKVFIVLAAVSFVPALTTVGIYGGTRLNTLKPPCLGGWMLGGAVAMVVLITP